MGDSRIIYTAQTDVMVIVVVTLGIAATCTAERRTSGTPDTGPPDT